MRKLFQTEWQGIAFASFARLSSKTPASAEFYEAFYRELFKRYASWDHLPAAWQEEKGQCAAFLAAQPEAGGRVLSVGCGLGVIEHALRSRAPGMDLYIHDVAPAAWGWIKREIPDDHRFVGWIPQCLPPGMKFDLVYLSAVDYILDDPTLINLLGSIRSSLKQGGRCLLVSASFDLTPRTAREAIVLWLRRLKQAGLAALDLAGLRHRGQFWGWLRTAEEYRRLMRAAGYEEVTDGCIDPVNPASYWIAGRNGAASPVASTQ